VGSYAHATRPSAPAVNLFGSWRTSLRGPLVRAPRLANPRRTEFEPPSPPKCAESAAPGDGHHVRWRPITILGRGRVPEAFGLARAATERYCLWCLWYFWYDAGWGDKGPRCPFCSHSEDPDLCEVSGAATPASDLLPFWRATHPRDPSSMKPTVPDEIRIPRKVLAMVAELHLRGYQWLRITPFIYEVGSWRCGITPVSNILAAHGAMPDRYDPSILPQYSSAMGRNYFGWDDAPQATPRQLAERFIHRFPAVVREGYGSDWVYVGWFSEMLHLSYPGTLPISHGNMSGPSATEMEFVGAPPLRSIPLPPPGWVRTRTEQPTL
jgi:hypothetical protein